MGKRVVATTKGAHGGFAEFAICPTVAMFEMPESIPLPDAAALFFPFHLAWLGLFDRAELKAGESVLIHAAAGGSGSAAVQLAVHTGARVFATAGTEEKVQLCRDLGARRRDQLQRAGLREPSCSKRPATKASTSCSTTSVKPCSSHRSSARSTTAAT